MVDSQDSRTGQLYIVTDRQSPVSDPFLVCLVKCKIDVPIAVHNPTDNISVIGVESCYCVR